MADKSSGGTSQRAAAMAAFAAAAMKKEVEKEFTPSSQLSAREKAMQNLNRKGVVSKAEVKGATAGQTQHGKALASLGIQDEPAAKVVPNWKLTAAQKNERTQIVSRSSFNYVYRKSIRSLVVEQFV